MKSKIILTLLFAAPIALLYFTEKHSFKALNVPADASTTGSIRQQSKRLQWEWQRLHDPATGKIPAGMRAKELAFAQTLPKDSDFEIEKSGTGQDFTLQGPYNVGGRTRGLAIDITNENIVFAGSVSGGLYRSTDGGNTWQKVTSPQQYLGVTSIVQDTRTGHTNNWYFSSGEGYGTSASADEAFYLGDGIFKSTDGGLSWNPLEATANGNPQSFTTNWQVIWNLATHPDDSSDVLFAATYGAIYKSTDGGSNWTTSIASSVSGSDSYFTDVACTSTGVVYATLSSDGQKGGIWRSADGTAPFVDITPDNFFNGNDTIHWPGVYDRTVIGIDPNNENVVYFLAHSPGYGLASLDFQGDTNWVSFWKYEYLSGDGDTTGGFWTDLSQNLPFDGSALGNIVLQGSYNMHVKVMPGNSNIVFICGTNIYRSTDGFTTNTNTTQIGGYGIGAILPFYTSYLNHHSDVHNLTFLPSNPDILISATDGGLYKTDNCLADTVAWTSLNNGYYTSQYYTVAIDHGTEGSNVITGGLQDWGSWWTNSPDPLATWTHPSHGDGAYCAVKDGGGTYYFSRQEGKMMKATLDNNGNVTAFKRFDPIGASKDNYQFINPFVLDPVDNNILYLSEGPNLWRNDALADITLDGSWDTISTGWQKFSWHLTDTTQHISCFAVSTEPAHRLYFGTSKKKIYKVNNAHTGNPTPVDITASNMPVAGYVTALAVDPRDGDKVMAVFSNYKVYSIWYSDNGGSSWKKVAGNLEQTQSGSGNGPSIRTASILPVGDGTIYLIGASTGLYATDTLIADSTVWIQQGANTIGNAVVNMIDTRSSDGFTVIATHGNGLYTTYYTSVSEIAGIKDNKWPSITNVLSLYPNPAQNNTTVEFELFEKTNVTIIIYDEAGREVQEVLKTQINKGKHIILVNTANLKAGIYYCTFTTPLYRTSRSLIIVK
ncbi:MAG: hypothetical protein POELPBGB_03820 [Bacteroidia bacterium]|nr:hypothetical protein [Bacteroidia bacterium]